MGMSFRRVAREDFPVIAGWLAQPHVARWWAHQTTPEAVEADFGPTVDGAEPAEDFLARQGDRLVGLIQRCRLQDYPEYAAELAALLAVPDEAMTIDYLVGEPDLLGRGVGTAMISAFVARLWADCPRAGSLIVPVATGNVASWRALERAGFTRAVTGWLSPDNPVDDGMHHVLRADRRAR